MDCSNSRYTASAPEDEARESCLPTGKGSNVSEAGYFGSQSPAILSGAEVDEGFDLAGLDKVLKNQLRVALAKFAEGASLSAFRIAEKAEPVVKDNDGHALEKVLDEIQHRHR